MSLRSFAHAPPSALARSRRRALRSTALAAGRFRAGSAPRPAPCRRARSAYRHGLVRPSRLVVGSVLIAALALVALPGLAGSRVPSPVEPLPASAFQPLAVPANMRDRRSRRSARRCRRRRPARTRRRAFVSPASRRRPARPPCRRTSPRPAPASVRKPPRYTLTGDATFYDNGTTAMRLPRGTIVIICGNGGCIERVVNDYGPEEAVADRRPLPADFFDICGCPSWSGTTTGDGLRLLTPARPGAVSLRRPFSHGPVRPQGRPSEAGKER